jgi:hypothetical protein
VDRQGCTVENSERFFDRIGKLSEGILWKPYLRVNRVRCPNAVNIDRFPIVVKMKDVSMRCLRPKRAARPRWRPVSAQA